MLTAEKAALWQDDAMGYPSWQCSGPNMIVVLYGRQDCVFSQLARHRVEKVARDFDGIEVDLRDQSEAVADGVRVIATPTLLLPDGRRLTGTPTVERLRRVFANMLGRDLPVPNKVWYLQRNLLFHGVPREEIEKFAHLFRRTRALQGTASADVCRGPRRCAHLYDFRRGLHAADGAPASADDDGCR